MFNHDLSSVPLFPSPHTVRRDLAVTWMTSLFLAFYRQALCGSETMCRTWDLEITGTNPSGHHTQNIFSVLVSWIAPVGNNFEWVLYFEVLTVAISNECVCAVGYLWIESDKRFLFTFSLRTDGNLFSSISCCGLFAKREHWLQSHCLWLGVEQEVFLFFGTQFCVLQCI